MSVQTKQYISKAILLSITMGVMLCVFEPLQLYFMNLEDYWFDFYNLFPVCMMMGAVLAAASVIALIIAYLIRPKLGQAAYLLYAVVFLCTYVQGNYLAGNLPVLDGSAVDWGNYAYQRKYTILLWLIVAGVTAVLLYKKKAEFTMRLYHGLTALILAVLVVTCVITGISRNGLIDKGDLTVTTDHFWSMSQEGQNYVIFLVDSIRGREMNQLLEEDPQVWEALKDFTYYDNTVVGYPLTYYSIYYIMGGDWYECDEPINDYKTNVLLHAPLFQEMEARDYTLDLYTLEMPFLDNDGFYRFGNFVRAQGRFSSYWKFMKLQLRLVGLKYAPYDLKSRCLALPDEFDELKEIRDVDSRIYSPENEFFLSLLQEDVQYVQGNTFKFIHINGAHAPFLYSRDLQLLTEETDYEEAVEAAMAMTEQYLQKLKDNGVYDNTAIVILSDHGYNSEPYEGLTYNPYDRQHGVLFMKGFGERHDALRVDNAPIAHGDLQDAYIKLADGSSGDAVFPFRAGDERARRFLWHTRYDSLHLEEYMQTGQAYDMETLLPTGRIYEWPEGLVQDAK